MFCVIEPTTGLDSSMSLDVMESVKNLANQKRTVLCTIHQPSPATYSLFNKLLLLACGRVIYFGDAIDIVDYFASSVYKFPYKDGSNPADYLIAVAGGFVASHSGVKISGEDLAKYYTRSELCNSNTERLNKLLALGAARMSTYETNAFQWARCHTSIFNQIVVLCHRSVIKVMKFPLPFIAISIM